MSSDPADSYDAFADRVARLTYLDGAGSVLHWDQEVMMPEGGQPARGKQVSALQTVRHDLLTDDDMGGWLEDLTDEAGEPIAALDDDGQAEVREVHREYVRAERVPSDLVERLSEVTSNALPVWEQAREDDDFDAFADTLAEIVDLRREQAAAIDPDRDPYAVLFEEYEPYLGVDTAEQVLEDLKATLVPLIDDVADSDVTAPEPFEGSYSDDAQEDLVREALDYLGYDWERGRLDTAPHPFSMGTQYDARVTTRFTPDDPMDALGSTVHEFGHATYTQGLPREAYGSPLGQDRDLSIHESQSRLWENHVGRSRPFWTGFAERVNDHLGLDAAPATYYRTANEVYDDNLIRVQADELTYHLHIVLRFEIERDLIRGDLAVDEVPAVWNDKMEEYLGLRPETDTRGCLQDIHWTHGSFGYFPTYSLGSVLAAQLDAAAREDLALDEQVRDGEFDPLRDWLGEHVHRHGARYETDDLVERATGESFTADYFTDYVEAKYRDLYDC
jgi:carboxypeptidase Taq